MLRQSTADRLQQVEEEVLALGDVVDSLLTEAADVLYGSNLAALERMNVEGHQVHKKRLAIEMGCLTLIAARRPPPGELRLLVASVEIAAELERLAEHAQRMSRANYVTAAPQVRNTLASLKHLAAEVQSLLDGALAALASRDAATARTVTGGMHKVDTLYQQIRYELLDIMKSRPHIANQAIFLSRSAYSLRRAADRVAGICDWVVFIVEGSPGTSDSIGLPEQLVDRIRDA